MKNLNKLIFSYLLLGLAFTLNSQEVYTEHAGANDLVRFSKIIDGHVYEGIVIDGVSGIRKSDLNLNTLWTIPLVSDLFPLDAAKINNNLIIVGPKVTGSSSTARSAMLIRIDDQGTAASLDFIREYDQSGRDLFMNVIENPSSTGFIIQASYPGDTSGLIELDLNGIPTNTHGYDGGDTQTWSGLNTGPLPYTLLGNFGGTTTGGYIEIDINFNSIHSKTYSNIRGLSGYVNRTSARKIIYGGTGAGNGCIASVDANGNTNWAKIIDQSVWILDVELASHEPIPNGFIESYYVVGRAAGSPNQEYFVSKFEFESVNNITQNHALVWTKYFETNQTTNNTGWLVPDTLSNKLYYTDLRDDGSSNLDIFTAITDLDLNSCVTQNLSYTLSDLSLSPINRIISSEPIPRSSIRDSTRITVLKPR